MRHRLDRRRHHRSPAGRGAHRHRPRPARRPHRHPRRVRQHRLPTPEGGHRLRGHPRRHLPDVGMHPTPPRAATSTTRGPGPTGPTSPTNLGGSADATTASSNAAVDLPARPRRHRHLDLTHRASNASPAGPRRPPTTEPRPARRRPPTATAAAPGSPRTVARRGRGPTRASRAAPPSRGGLDTARTWALSRRSGHSHSMVPGGLLVTSRTTRLTSRTSLVMRVEIFASTS